MAHSTNYLLAKKEEALTSGDEAMPSDESARMRNTLPVVGAVDSEELKETPWRATASRVHFHNVGRDVPWCLQRKGARARPLKRYFAEGVGIESARGIGIDICPECLDIAS